MLSSTCTVYRPSLNQSSAIQYLQQAGSCYTVDQQLTMWTVLCLWNIYVAISCKFASFLCFLQRTLF